MIRKRTLLILSLVALAGLFLVSAADPPRPTVLTEDLVFAQFADGVGQGVIADDEGLRLQTGAESGTYLSPVIVTPLPFNALVPSWEGSGLDPHHFALQVRTRRPAAAWSPWFALDENDDWTEPGSETTVGAMLAVPAQDSVHSEIQFAVTLTQEETLPRLATLRLTVIDSVTHYSPGPDIPPGTGSAGPLPKTCRGGPQRLVYRFRLQLQRRFGL